MQDVSAEGNTNCAADHKKDFKLITGLCPVQKVKVMDSGGTLVEMFAMIDSGSNTSVLSKNAAERLGIALCGQPQSFKREGIVLEREESW